MIGDRNSDVQAGQRAGAHAYLFTGGNLDDLAKQIMNNHFSNMTRNKNA